MCTRFFTILAFPFSGRNEYWRERMLASVTAGSGIPILPLKKSARAKLGADIHRRGQLSSGLHTSGTIEGLNNKAKVTMRKILRIPDHSRRRTGSLPYSRQAPGAGDRPQILPDEARK